MKKLKERDVYLKLFGIGLALVLIQTLFQYNEAYLKITSTISSYIKPFVIGIFVAIMINPLVEIVEKKSKFTRLTSMWLSIFILLGTITGLMFWFIPALVASFEDISQNFPLLQERFNFYLGETFKFLREKNLLIADFQEIEKAVQDFIVSNLSNIRNIVFSISLNVVYWLAEIFIFFLGVFLAIYFILYKDYFMSFIKKIIFLIKGEEAEESGFDFLLECKDIFLNYMLGRILVSVIVGIVAYIVMIFGKVPYALIISVMIGIGNMIPYFGSIVAGLVSIIIVGLIDPIKVLYILLAMGVAQTVDGYVVGPLILGKSVGLSSFWIIASVIIMGNIMGTLGMFLGVPIFAVLKLIYTKLLKNKEEKIQLEIKSKFSNLEEENNLEELEKNLKKENVKKEEKQ